MLALAKGLYDLLAPLFVALLHKSLEFSKELRDVSGYSSIHINELITFADFIFDGILMDIVAQTQIAEAREQCDEAIRRVKQIRAELCSRL